MQKEKAGVGMNFSRSRPNISCEYSPYLTTTIQMNPTRVHTAADDFQRHNLLFSDGDDGQLDGLGLPLVVDGRRGHDAARVADLPDVDLGGVRVGVHEASLGVDVESA